jgi:Ca2+-binding RTX toxin-like protein
MRRLARFVLLSVIAALMLPGASQAGTVETDGDTLLISTHKGPDILNLQRIDATTLRVDQLNPNLPLRTTSPGCALTTQPEGETRVDCDSSFAEVRVETGGERDRFKVGKSRFPVRRDSRGPCPGRERDLRASLDVVLGDGADVVAGSRRKDWIRGGSGRDLLMGCGGNDALYGDNGRDHLSGDNGGDRLYGRAGSDVLFGCMYDPSDVNIPQGAADGRDLLFGHSGSDFLLACDGVDKFFAGGDDDDLNASDRRGELTRCGGGEDLVLDDESDRLDRCEHPTNCATDLYPFIPCPHRSIAASPPKRQLPNVREYPS